MKTLRRALYSWVDRKFLGGCSNYNSLATRKSCRSKKQAREAFIDNDIPHAKGEIFYGLLAPFPHSYLWPIAEGCSAGKNLVAKFGR